MTQLKKYEHELKQDTQSPKAYYEAATIAHQDGNTDKATHYLRMALNTHTTDLLNQYDIKSLGDTNNG